MMVVFAAPTLFSQSAPRPPIDFRYTGAANPKGGSLIAVIIDGQGRRYYAKAGDFLEGRYHILRVDKNAIQVAYVDGTGKRTIRLTTQQR
jgi:hypothetical protein